MSKVYEILLGLAEKGKLDKKKLDKFVIKGWITKEQETEILKIAKEIEENGEGVNYEANDRTGNK